MIFTYVMRVFVWPLFSRYQPEQPSLAYQMANTRDEIENAECFNEVNVDMLPQPDDSFTIRNLLFPSNTEPTPLSGLVVNICTSLIGKHLSTRSPYSPGQIDL